MYALVHNITVIDVAQEPFDVAAPLIWVECPSGTVAGDSYENGNIVLQVHSQGIDHVRATKTKELEAYRYAKEVGGMNFNGVMIDTSRSSQQMIAAARTIAKEKKAENVWYTFDWKAQNGWYQLNCDQVIGMADQIAAHVQHCFSEEKRLSTIMQGLTTYQDVSEFDFISQWRDS